MAAKAAEALENPSAEEKKPEKTPKEKKQKVPASAGSKVKSAVLLVVLLLIAAFVCVLTFNPLGLREKYLSAPLADVPLVKDYFTPSESDAPPSYDEINARADDLQKQLDEANAALDAANAQNETKQREIDRLSAFERSQTQFKADKEEFDTKIALNDASAYSAFYESISPENAEKLYPQAKSDAERQKLIDAYIASIDKTDESAVAKALEQLILTDLDLVVSILKSLTTAKSGEILGEMSAENAASVLKRWDPIRYP